MCNPPLGNVHEDVAAHSTTMHRYSEKNINFAARGCLYTLPSIIAHYFHGTREVAVPKVPKWQFPKYQTNARSKTLTCPRQLSTQAAEGLSLALFWAASERLGIGPGAFSPPPPAPSDLENHES